MSRPLEVARMRGLNSRRASRMVRPMKHTTPKMPPTTIATSCFCGAVMKCSYRACGVSRPTRWPPRMARMPMWNQLLPSRIHLPESNWLEPLRQV